MAISGCGFDEYFNCKPGGRAESASAASHVAQRGGLHQCESSSDLGVAMGCERVTALLSASDTIALAEELGFRFHLNSVGKPVLVGRARPSADLASLVSTHSDEIAATLHIHVERWEGLIRFGGRDSWMALRDVRPCGSCGGEVFFRSSKRIACVNCIKVGPGETVFGSINMVAVAKQISNEQQPART